MSEQSTSTGGRSKNSSIPFVNLGREEVYLSASIASWILLNRHILICRRSGASSVAPPIVIDSNNWKMRALIVMMKEFVPDILIEETVYRDITRFVTQDSFMLAIYSSKKPKSSRRCFVDLSIFSDNIDWSKTRVHQLASMVKAMLRLSETSVYYQSMDIDKYIIKSKRTYLSHSLFSVFMDSNIITPIYRSINSIRRSVKIEKPYLNDKQIEKRVLNKFKKLIYESHPFVW